MSALDLQNAEHVIAALNAARERLLDHRLRTGSSLTLPARGAVIVTGDLHDNPVHYQKILKLARLDACADRHVVFQELIHSERLVNGVDLSHRMLIRVADLITQFPLQVHPLLANHELSQMTGRGVSKGAGNSVVLFDDGLEFVFRDAWEDVADAINTFIRALPLALRSESGLFCAHSLPAARMMERFDPAILDRAIEDSDYETNQGSAYLMTWGRGTSDEQIEELAARWNVKLFCLGHEHVETGCEVRGRRVIRINSDHEGAAVLPVDLAHVPDAEEAMMSAIRLSALGVR